MQRAETAAKAGHSARAIRLLGRVLELEKDQKQAKTMLSRLRTRERTVRRLMLGAASLALTALSSGAAVLWYMTPPSVENLPRVEDRTSSGAPRCRSPRPDSKQTLVGRRRDQRDRPPIPIPAAQDHTTRPSIPRPRSQGRPGRPRSKCSSRSPTCRSPVIRAGTTP
jgi:hypothetical protein